jgi:hypothetical protein
MELLLGFGVVGSAEDVESDDGQNKRNESNHWYMEDPTLEDFCR